MSHLTLEQEAIVLNAVVTMVDDMVNHAIFCPLGSKKQNTNLMPQTAATLRQFAILLRDFLSPVQAKGKNQLPFGLPTPPKDGCLTDFTTLFYLKLVCENPLIGSDTGNLSKNVNEFADWLECKAFVPKVWFANINVETDLSIKRFDFIRMGGDIGKHNFLRLGGQANKLRRILHDNNVEIDEGQSYAALPDCWDWFHTHLFAYHASALAEFLNNIRYAIRDYVLPTTKDSYRIIAQIDENFAQYTFERPADITSDFAWSQYHSLLDNARSETTFPRFSVSPYFKDQF